MSFYVPGNLPGPLYYFVMYAILHSRYSFAANSNLARYNGCQSVFVITYPARLTLSQCMLFYAPGWLGHLFVLRCNVCQYRFTGQIRNAIFPSHNVCYWMFLAWYCRPLVPGDMHASLTSWRRFLAPSTILRWMLIFVPAKLDAQTRQQYSVCHSPAKLDAQTRQQYSVCHSMVRI